MMCQYKTLSNQCFFKNRILLKVSNYSIMCTFQKKYKIIMAILTDDHHIECVSSLDGQPQDRCPLLPAKSHPFLEAMYCINYKTSQNDRSHQRLTHNILRQYVSLFHSFTISSMEIYYCVYID